MVGGEGVAVVLGEGGDEGLELGRVDDLCSTADGAVHMVVVGVVGVGQLDFVFPAGVNALDDTKRFK